MGWVVNITPRPLYPREREPVPIVQEAAWAPEPVWASAENIGPSGIRYPDHSIPGSSHGQCKCTVIGSSFNITESKKETI